MKSIANALEPGIYIVLLQQGASGQKLKLQVINVVVNSESEEAPGAGLF